MQKHERSFCRVALALSTGVLSSVAFAEQPNDRYWGQLQGFWPKITSEARLDFPGTRVPGTQIRLEDELGLSDREILGSLLLGGRIGEKWRVEFEYYKLDRTGTRATQRDIHWGDLTFPASASISTTFDTAIYRLSGGYSFYKTPQAEAGGVFGLHMTDFKVALAGTASVGNQAASRQSEAKDALVPLPTIGLYGSYVFADKWTVHGRVDYFSLNYEQYNGSLINWTASVDWRFHPNVGVGLGYRYVDYKVSVEKDNFHGEVKYSFSGPTLYLEGAF